MNELEQVMHAQTEAMSTLSHTLQRPHAHDSGEEIKLLSTIWDEQPIEPVDSASVMAEFLALNEQNCPHPGPHSKVSGKPMVKHPLVRCAR